MVLFTDALPEGGLRLSCAVPGSEVYAGFGRTQFYFLTIGTLFVFAMVCISRYLSRNIVDPLKELHARRRSLKGGISTTAFRRIARMPLNFPTCFLLFNHMTQEISALKYRITRRHWSERMPKSNIYSCSSIRIFT